MNATTDLTRQAVNATLHCLTGCVIGEVVGMVIATALGWPDLPSILLAVALAFLFGYALTVRSVLRSGLGLRGAIGVALAADTVSIAIMEAVDNGFILIVPGAMAAGIVDWLFWSSLLVGFVIAFVLTVPVNRAMIARGKGHAVVHAYHHGGGHPADRAHAAEGPAGAPSAGDRDPGDRRGSGPPPRH